MHCNIMSCILSPACLLYTLHDMAVVHACLGRHGNRKWSNCLMSVPYGEIMCGVPLISAGC
jgi:hypothetical protein